MVCSNNAESSRLRQLEKLRKPNTAAERHKLGHLYTFNEPYKALEDSNFQQYIGRHITCRCRKNLHFTPCSSSCNFDH